MCKYVCFITIITIITFYFFYFLYFYVYFSPILNVYLCYSDVCKFFLLLLSCCCTGISPGVLSHLILKVDFPKEVSLSPGLQHSLQATINYNAFINVTMGVSQLICTILGHLVTHFTSRAESRTDKA